MRVLRAARGRSACAWPAASSVQKSRKMPSTKPKSPMRLTMNALLPAVRVGQLLVPEADQRVGAEADAFPADEHQQQVVAQHQRQHREGEEVQVGEEAPERRRRRACSRWRRRGSARRCRSRPGSSTADSGSTANATSTLQRRRRRSRGRGRRAGSGAPARGRTSWTKADDREQEGRRDGARRRCQPTGALAEPSLQRRAPEPEDHRSRQRQQRDQRQVRRGDRLRHALRIIRAARSVASTSMVSKVW